MNNVLIIFLVVVLLIAIFMAIQFYNPNYLIRNSKSLNVFNDNASSRFTIPVSLIDLPGSSRYYYEGWVYIQSNDPVYSEHVIFNRGNNFVMTLMGSTLNIYVKNSNKSTQDISANGVLNPEDNDKLKLHRLLSVSNFPFQKWTQFVINVNGQSVDFYLDGKFVNHVKSPNTIIVNEDDPITYGNQYTNGNIARFKRPAASINPQGVWSDYMLGSGQNYSVSDYHADAQITKNKQVRTEQRLF